MPDHYFPQISYFFCFFLKKNYIFTEMPPKSGRHPKPSKSRHKSGAINQLLTNDRSRQQIIDYVAIGNIATTEMARELAELAGTDTIVPRTTLNYLFQKIKSMHIKMGLTFNECIDLIIKNRV